jgi:hypothetical protein
LFSEALADDLNDSTTFFASSLVKQRLCPEMLAVKAKNKTMNKADVFISFYPIFI